MPKKGEKKVVEPHEIDTEKKTAELPIKLTNAQVKMLCEDIAKIKIRLEKEERKKKEAADNEKQYKKWKNDIINKKNNYTTCDIEMDRDGLKILGLVHNELNEKLKSVGDEIDELIYQKIALLDEEKLRKLYDVDEQKGGFSFSNIGSADEDVDENQDEDD